MFDRQNLEIYDRIPLPESFSIPQRSRLYSLEPIGTRTPSTESVSSYLTRLAQEHCLPLKKLIMGEIAPVILKDRYQPEMLSKSVSSIFGNSNAKPAINGMREMTQSLVDALEQLTLRQNLRYLTCLAYQGVIKDKSLFRQHKAWCPQCFHQQKQDKTIVYEPLSWSFKDVNYCLEHSSRLRDRCPHCDFTQKAIANFSRPGYCNKCRSWLGNCEDGGLLLSYNRFQASYFTVKSIGDLIALIPRLSHQSNLKDLKKKLKLILFCFERAIHQDLSQYVILIKIIEKLKIDLGHNYSKPLNLIELVIPTCQKAKISVPQLFESNYDDLAQILAQNIATDYKIL